MTKFDPTAIMEVSRRAHREQFGTSVRCPECGAGVGKFCLRPGISTYNGPSDRVVHQQRVALANR